MGNEEKGNDLSHSPQKQLSPELAIRFLERAEKDAELKLREMEVKERELETQRDENQNNAGTARHLADVQLKDNQDHRAKLIEYQKCRMGVVVVVAFLGVGFLTYALYAGKEEIALEIVKVVLYAGIGGIGGYGLAYKRSSENQP